MSRKRGPEAAANADATLAAALSRAAAAEARAAAAEARLAIVEECFIHTRPDLFALVLPLIVYNGFGAEIVNCGYTCTNLYLGEYDELWKYLLNVERGSNKRTPLMYFASVGDAAKLSRALSLGAKKRTEALSWAVRFGKMQAATALVAAGADLKAASFTMRITTLYGDTRNETLAPLSLAAKFGHNAMIDYLCDIGGLAPSAVDFFVAQSLVVLSNLVARSGTTASLAKTACDAAARRVCVLGNAEPSQIIRVLHAVIALASKHLAVEAVAVSSCDFFTTLVDNHSKFSVGEPLLSKIAASGALSHLKNVQKSHPASEDIASALSRAWRHLTHNGLIGVDACLVSKNRGLESAIRTLQSFPASSRVVTQVLQVIKDALSVRDKRPTVVDAVIDTGAIPALVRVLRDGTVEPPIFSSVLGILALLPGTRVVAADAHIHIAACFTRCLPKALRSERDLPTWYTHIFTMITRASAGYFATVCSQLLAPLTKSAGARRTSNVQTHSHALRLVGLLSQYGFAAECYAAMGGADYFKPTSTYHDLPLTTNVDLLWPACFVIRQIVFGAGAGPLLVRRAELLASEHVMSVLYEGMKRSWTDRLDPKSGAAVSTPTHAACLAIRSCLDNGAPPPRDREGCMLRLLRVLGKCRERVVHAAADQVVTVTTRQWIETAAVVCDAVTLLLAHKNSSSSSSSLEAAALPAAAAADALASKLLAITISDACRDMLESNMFSGAGQRPVLLFISLARNYPQATSAAAVPLVAALHRCVLNWGKATTPATTDMLHGHLQMLLALAERPELKPALLSARVIDALSSPPPGLQTVASRSASLKKTLAWWGKAELASLKATSALWNKAVKMFVVKRAPPPRSLPPAAAAVPATAAVPAAVPAAAAAASTPPLVAGPAAASTPLVTGLAAAAISSASAFAPAAIATPTSSAVAVALVEAPAVFPVPSLTGTAHAL